MKGIFYFLIFVPLLAVAASNQICVEKYGGLSMRPVVPAPLEVGGGRIETGYRAVRSSMKALEDGYLSDLERSKLERFFLDPKLSESEAAKQAFEYLLNLRLQCAHSGEAAHPFRSHSAHRSGA